MNSQLSFLIRQIEKPMGHVSVAEDVYKNENKII